MRVAHEKPPLLELLQHRRQRLWRLGLLRAEAARAREALDHTRAIGVGLQAPDAPRARVAERAVVEVHRVLRGDDDAHAERARLLHQRDERPLRRRVRGMRRQVAVHLVEDHQRAQALAARERAHVREHLFEHDAEHERALFVVEVGDAEDRRRRAAVLCGREPCARVERRALAKTCERGRDEQRVERRRERFAIVLRHEGVERKRADVFDGRVGEVCEQRRERCVFAGHEPALGEHREQHVLTALCRVGLATDEPEHERDRRDERGARGLAVGVPARRPSLERREHVQGLTRGRAWRHDAHVGRVVKGAERRFVDARRREALRPCLCELDREHLGRAVVRRRGGGIDVGRDRARVEAREREQEIRKVALHVDRDHGHARAQRLLHDHGDETRLAAARHTENDPMRDEVVGRHAVRRGQRHPREREGLAEVERGRGHDRVSFACVG